MRLIDVGKLLTGPRREWSLKKMVTIATHDKNSCVHIRCLFPLLCIPLLLLENEDV